MATVIDYAARSISAAAIRDAGHLGAVRYCSPPREAWMKAKPVSAPEMQELKKHALDVAFVWQYGGANNPDVMRGARGGELDAKAADEQLKTVRRTGYPVFFAVDFDITLEQWNSVAVEYFRAACKVLGRDRVGIYGHSRVCDWARQDGVIGSAGGGKFLQWQTTSWSRGAVSPHAVLLQSTHNVTGPDGVQVDVNQVLHPYWGQHPPSLKTTNTPPPSAGASHKRSDGNVLKPQHGRRGDPVWLPEVLRAFGVQVREMPGWKQWGMGDFDNIEGVACHHTAGAATSAEYIARNPMLGHGLSSQIHLARDGVVTLCGAGIAWHYGAADSWANVPQIFKGYVTRKSNGKPTSFTAANALMIGIEAVNKGDGTQPWPEKQLDAYARTCAAICWFLGLPVSRVIGHKEGAPSRKIDPNFDMDAFRRRVDVHIKNPPFLNSPKEAPMAMPRIITSLINPKVKFQDDFMLSIIDATCWKNHALLRKLCEESNLDPDQIINDAIAADRAKQ